jgi:outer membrane protein OmpA-like peptidoglycan-associated protein
MCRKLAHLLYLTSTLLLLPSAGQAQLGGLVDAARRAAGNEIRRTVTTRVGEATACALGNRECVEEAQQNGEKVVIVDDDGNPVTDENGNPIADPEEAEATMEEPGQGRWANYDYLRGERAIYNTRWNIEDTDNPPALVPSPDVRVGRIPANIEFISGNMQIVQLDGLNTAEFTAATKFRVPLSEPLPEDFSLEFTIQNAAPNAFIYVMFEPYDGQGFTTRSYESHYLNLWRGPGIYRQGDRVSGVDQVWSINQQLTPVKFQVDDGYAILYVGGERVAQVPNFVHPVGSAALEFDVVANQNSPAYLRDIRVDYGVEDPVSVLETAGEYTTRSIYFDFNSSDLRPESTPELERVRGLLAEFGGTVVIEGHTDSMGDDAYNLRLSAERAEAVKTYLVGRGITADLIQTSGAGETQPMGDNATDDGRQMNRRVVVRPLAE